MSGNSSSVQYERVFQSEEQVESLDHDETSSLVSEDPSETLQVKVEEEEEVEVFHTLNHAASSTILPPVNTINSTSTDKQLPPPDYYEATHSNIQPPPYQDAVIDAFVVEGHSDEILIDGLPVGHPFSLVVNMLLTLAFDFIGYLFTYILATSHAAKAGSRLGLGLTMLRYGIYFHYAVMNGKLSSKYYDDDQMSPAEMKAENTYMSYLMMILGVMIILYANADYYRVNKIRNLLISPTVSTV